jgi:hypothetical protein
MLPIGAPSASTTIHAVARSLCLDSQFPCVFGITWTNGIARVSANSPTVCEKVYCRYNKDIWSLCRTRSPVCPTHYDPPVIIRRIAARLSPSETVRAAKKA